MPLCTNRRWFTECSDTLDTMITGSLRTPRVSLKRDAGRDPVSWSLCLFLLLGRRLMLLSNREYDHLAGIGSFEPATTTTANCCLRPWCALNWLLVIARSRGWIHSESTTPFEAKSCRDSQTSRLCTIPLRSQRIASTSTHATSSCIQQIRWCKPTPHCTVV